MIKDFAIFITSHKSPNECKSRDSLRACGYTGPIHIVVDNLDPTRGEYESDVIIFDKAHYVYSLDTGISSENPQYAAVLYARAAVEEIAKRMGYKYFIVMDDDITGFRIRYTINGSLKSYSNFNIEDVILSYIDFMNVSNSICIALANDGSFIGGADIVVSGKMLERRTCHTVFLRDVDKPLDWSFAVNEDYITSLRYGNIGTLMFTLPFLQRNITGMNDREEGMHDVYISTTDFQRSFYSVIACPWTCKPRLYKGKYVNSMNKDTAFPKIISSSYRR